VCEKTYDILMREPYAGQFQPVDPLDPIASEDAQDFDCSRQKVRHPRETKGMDYNETHVTTEGVCDTNCC
ncbi:MAG: methyltransferase, partial [Planctomycetota bacterium]